MSFLLPSAVFDQHVIVLGKTRSGKSSAMRYMVEHLLDQGKPVCIVDPKGDWWGLKSSQDGKSGGYPLVIFGGEHGDVPINARSGAAIAELTATENRPAMIDLGGWMVSERTQFWIDFASTFFKLSRGRRWLVIDEAHNLCPKGKIMDPNAGKMLHWSNRLASEGLGRGISLIAASQRPQKVNNDFLTSCETLIAMRVIHAADRGAIEDWIDGCGDSEKAPEVVGSLAQMRRGEAWVWSPEAEFGPKRLQFPMFSTYDSFKPQPADQPAKLKGWADVDLALVRKKLEAVLREAEANDPAKLKARIRELEAAARKAHPQIQTKAIVDERMVGRAIFAATKQYRNALSEQAKAFRQIADYLERSSIIAQREALRALPDIPGGEIQGKERLAPGKPPVPTHPRPVQSHVESNGHIGASQRRILKALAELEAIGKESAAREMVAFWSEYKPNSGGYNNYLGGLRTAGLIEYPGSGLVRLTDEGRSAVGIQDAPTQDEIMRRVNELLNGSQQKILSELYDARDGMTRTELAERAGFQPNSGGYNNYLGAMRTAGLIEYPSSGTVKAAEWLFI